MNILKIEKGVPIPRPRGKTSGLSFTLRQMKKGDSVFIAGSTPNKAHSAAIQTFGKSGHITVRSEDGGVRVWKVV